MHPKSSTRLLLVPPVQAGPICRRTQSPGQESFQTLLMKSRKVIIVLRELCCTARQIALSPSQPVEALPRILPREITDTSDEIQRSNEDPKNATLRSQSTRRWEPTQPWRQGPEEGLAVRPHRGSPAASIDKAHKDSANRVSATSMSASDLSAPLSSQWPLLNEEGIQHASGGFSNTRLISSSPTVHESISPNPTEEAKLQSSSSDRSLKPTATLQESLEFEGAQSSQWILEV